MTTTRSSITIFLFAAVIHLSGCSRHVEVLPNGPDDSFKKVSFLATPYPNVSKIIDMSKVRYFDASREFSGDMETAHFVYEVPPDAPPLEVDQEKVDVFYNEEISELEAQSLGSLAKIEIGHQGRKQLSSGVINSYQFRVEDWLTPDRRFLEIYITFLGSGSD